MPSIEDELYYCVTDQYCHNSALCGYRAGFYLAHLKNGHALHSNNQRLIWCADRKVNSDGGRGNVCVAQPLSERSQR